MADDDTTLNQPNEGEEEAQDQTPPEAPETPEKESEDTSPEEQPAETPDEADEGQGEPPETTEEPEDKPPSRREQLRVQQLLRKYGPPEQRQNPQQQRQPQGIDFRNQLDAEEPVYNQLEEQTQQFGNQQYQQGQNDTLKQVQTSEWRTLLHVDAPQVESKYKFLNPKDRESFHPALSDAINTAYEDFVGWDEQTKLVNNPVRYSDFVEGYIELASEIAREMNRDTTRNITKQAAQTGLRPDGSSAKRMDLSKAPEDMSNEELDAYLKQAVPKK